MLFAYVIFSLGCWCYNYFLHVLLRYTARSAILWLVFLTLPTGW